MTCVTVFSTVFADAPGYVALIWIDGGAMVGYCATGSWKIDAMPASIRMIAITHAKIGRSIKNLAMKRGSLVYCTADAAAGALALLAAGAAAGRASAAGRPPPQAAGADGTPPPSSSAALA